MQKRVNPVDLEKCCKMTLRCRLKNRPLYRRELAFQSLGSPTATPDHPPPTGQKNIYENERPALNPETRTQNKCSWKKRVDRQAREMFAEISRYTPASKNQKRQACKSRLERSALRTGLLNPHNSLPAAQTATKPSNSTLSWRWRSPHASVTLHGHPPGPFESL